MIIYLGFDIEIRKDWEEVVPPPHKPANWKDETYEAKLPELRQKQLEGLPDNLLAGRIAAVYMIYGGPPTLDSKGKLAKHTIVKTLPGAFVDAVTKAITTGNTAVRLVGFNTMQRLRQCGWTLIAEGCNTASWLWEPRLASDRLDVINLLTSSGASGMTQEDIIRSFGVDPRTAAAADTLTGGPEQVRAVQRMSVAMGFVE